MFHNHPSQESSLGHYISDFSQWSVCDCTTHYKVNNNGFVDLRMYFVDIQVSRYHHAEKKLDSGNKCC